MGKYSLSVEKKAKKELADIFKSGDKKSIKNIEIFFSELENEPEKGSGNPEKLKYQLSNFWSRRINSKDRLIYKIDDSEMNVLILSAKGHYGSK